MGRLWSELEQSNVTASDCLAAQIAADDRPNRLDLTGELCCAPDGASNVLQSVKLAEQRLVDSQTTKAAGPVGGDPAFHTALTRLILGEDVPLDRLGAVTAAGRQGAHRLALDLLHLANREATLWVPNQGGTDILPLAEAAEVYSRSYRLFAPGGTDLSLEDMLTDLRSAAPGDVIYLQACCHNPTGLDLPVAIWGAIAGIILETGAVPFVDVTGQGLGLGLEKDVDGLQSLCVAVPELLITVDCSPSFGLGRDGAGLVLVQGETPLDANRARYQLERLLDQGTGPVPDHGPNVVSHILYASDFRDAWERELRQNRQRLAETRAKLASALIATTGLDQWDYLATGRGLFVRLPLDSDQITALCTEHGLYLCPDGRANLSALTDAGIQQLADAVAACLQHTETAPPNDQTDAQGDVEEAQEGSPDDSADDTGNDNPEDIPDDLAPDPSPAADSDSPMADAS